MNGLSTERAIEVLYTIRAYYASLTAGYPKGKDRRGIDDVMCSEIANSCLMAIKALEQTEPERMTNEEITKSIKEIKEMLVYIGTYGNRSDDTPMDVRIRVKEIVDRWKNEGDMNK